MTDFTRLLALFFNAFVAATLLPALSEVTFAGLLVEGIVPPLWLFITATGGNVLGSVLNWWLGGRLLRFQGRRWFPFSAKQIKRGQAAFSRFGTPTLLLAWVPVIGDPLTLAAGIFRTPFWPFMAYVTAGKAARYGLIMVGVDTLILLP